MELQTQELAIGYRRRRKEDIYLARGLNLRLEPGKMVGLLGPNGVGKSTLLRTLAGMQAPLDGRVLLQGNELRRFKPSELAMRISLVLTAAPQAGMMTGYELVALGRLPHTDWLGKLSDRDRIMIAWALTAVAAESLAEQALSELSDGQRQKLMIARALAQETDIMLLDEPTAFLDLPRRVETMQLLKSLAQQTDRAILISSHDLDLALRNCDQLWLMTNEALRVGVPEDLVLDGSISKTFRAAGISFDERSGAFALEQTSGACVHVDGQGTQSIWMRRALERSGYRLEQGTAAANISREANGAGPEWHLTIDGRLSRYGSIGAVLKALEDAKI